MTDGSEGEKKKSEIWLWHRCLGHASFRYLKKLFPSLFAKSDISGFHCDICELAKSHRASFPLILNKSLADAWNVYYLDNIAASHRGWSFGTGLLKILHALCCQTPQVSFAILAGDNIVTEK